MDSGMWPLIVLIGVVAMFAWRARLQRANKRAQWVGGVPPDTQHCMSCGEDSPDPEGPLRGNTVLEVVLWVFLLWPIAIVYSVWRRIGKGSKRACPVCGAAALVPITTPAARAHKRRLDAA